MSLRISFFISKELQQITTLLKSFDKENSKQIRKAVKEVTTPEWKDAVSEYVETRPEATVLAATARVYVSNSNIQLVSANSNKRLSGGGRINEIYAPIEFGVSDRNAISKYPSKRAGKMRGKLIERHTHRQFVSRRKAGPVYNAAADRIPKIAALFVQTTMRTFYELIEKGGAK